jgi:hypothetical protein
MEWRVHEKVNEAVITLRGYIRDTCWGEARVKWDGCVDLFLAGNVPYDHEHGWALTKRDKDACDSCIHICGIPDFSKDLEKIFALQVSEFPDLDHEK